VLAYIVRRLLLMIPTLIGVLAVVFFIMAFAPGGFGGRQLTAEGAQTEGYDARRYLKQQQRRYGVDLPTAVQFARWVNQISPVGFLMSDQLSYTEQQTREVRDRLESLALNTHPRYLEQATELVLEVAAYQGMQPVEAAKHVREQLQTPVEAMSLFDWVGVSLDPTIASEIRQDIAASLEKYGPASAQTKLIQELSFEISGLARVRFDQPAFKSPDLGRTLGGRRVADRILEAVPITILLNVITIPIIYVVAIFAGVYAAKHRGGAFDVISGGTFIALWSVPVIWAGVMMVTYLANRDALYLFPPFGLHDMQADRMPYLPRFGDGGFQRGYLLDMVWHLILPIICLTYGGFAVMSKVMRGAMLDNLSADFVRTARAKGLPERQVLWRHTFRNGILPLITMAASIIPALFVGSVVVETLFAINGMGRLAVQAAFAKDRDLVMATTLMAGVLGLMSQLIRDICYAIADPRVSYD